MRIHTIVVLVFAVSLPAQKEVEGKAPKTPDLHEVLTKASQLLVELQEHYVRDRRVGRMRNDALPAWQAKERERLEKVRKDGKPNVEWPYEGVYRVRGIIPPGYRVGGTAIACLALAEMDGFADEANSRAAVTRGIEFMLDELSDNELLGPGPKRGYDVRGWAHTYGLRAFLHAEKHGYVEKALGQRIKKMIPHLLDCLAKNECSAGGWNYANNRCSPFMTGSTLIALYQARAQGYAFDDGLVNRALTALEKARFASGSFVYSGQTRPGQQGRRMSAMPGACARAAVAELCLLRAGRSDAKRLRVAVDAFFEHWDELYKRKSQQGTHVGAYGIAPYYFMYGHTYAALAIEALPEKERPALRVKMQETLWRTREKDGGWNDRIFPRSKAYSTAMAMLALAAPALDPVPEWKPQKPTGKK